MGRYVLCPYYVDENKKTVSCEDVCRSFNDMDEKWQWMAMYCNNDWMSCPFAADLNEAYYRQEKGDEMALQVHEIKALKSENRSLSIKLGRARKQLERLQKKCDELRAVNQSFIRVNEGLEKQKKDIYKKWREAKAELDKGNDQTLQELQKLGEIYEQRMCYLIDTFTPEGYFLEADAVEWAGDKAFALVSNYTEHEQLAWMVKFEEKKEDGKEEQE